MKSSSERLRELADADPGNEGSEAQELWHRFSPLLADVVAAAESFGEGDQCSHRLRAPLIALRDALEKK